ncbi:MAG: hypothetical protein GXO59_03270 [Dictyoglomi bacterium]|nr:hypothetical protein [Dictyoglomota bacterium]
MKISTKSAGSSKYKGVFNLLFRKGAWDFYEKDTISFSQGDLDDHHIFPKKFLERKGIKEEVDSVLNRTLILSSTNRHISSKSPASYIQEMIKIHGSKEAVRLILDKHFINGEMLEILQSVDDDTPASIVEERFREFIHMREELIKKEIKTLVM